MSKVDDKKNTNTSNSNLQAIQIIPNDNEMVETPNDPILEKNDEHIPEDEKDEKYWAKYSAIWQKRSVLVALIFGSLFALQLLLQFVIPTTPIQVSFASLNINLAEFFKEVSQVFLSLATALIAIGFVGYLILVALAYFLVPQTSWDEIFQELKELQRKVLEASFHDPVKLRTLIPDWYSTLDYYISKALKDGNYTVKRRLVELKRNTDENIMLGLKKE